MADTETPLLLKNLLGPESFSQQLQCRIMAACTIDGSASIAGTSQLLGNDLDTNLLLQLRQWSDCVIVGAGTIRAENYAGIVIPKNVQNARENQGQDRIPPLVIISQSLNFPSHANQLPRLFSEYTRPHIFLTDLRYANAGAVEKLEHYGFEVIDIPGLSSNDIINFLQTRGFRRIVSEGGPQVNQALLAAGLVDKIHLTLDPRLCLGTETKSFGLSDSSEIVELELEYCHPTSDGVLFLRYGVKK